MDHFSGRTAAVTGAASGIGLALCEAFVAEGMNVVMSDINEAALLTQQARLRGDGATIEAVVVDVREQASVDAVATAAVSRFGGLHVAVNNAGVVNRGFSWELTIEDWHRVLDVNLWGVIHGVRAFVPPILATKEPGYVVNVASMAAVTIHSQLGPYTVAKHGVLGLSDVLRAEMVELDAPVGVSVVMPGMIRTGMNPMGIITAEHVAANVVDAMKSNRPYVFTDDHSTAEVTARLEAILAARDSVLPGGHTANQPPIPD